VNVLRTLTDVAFGVFALANLATPVAQTGTGGAEEWVAKLGALGLCAFMVFQNYRQSEAMARVLRAKDDQLITLTKQYLDASQRHTDALNGISAALRSRPCIVGDRQFDEAAPDRK